MIPWKIYDFTYVKTVESAFSYVIKEARLTEVLFRFVGKPVVSSTIRDRRFNVARHVRVVPWQFCSFLVDYSSNKFRAISSYLSDLDSLVIGKGYSLRLGTGRGSYREAVVLGK